MDRANSKRRKKRIEQTGNKQEWIEQIQKVSRSESSKLEKVKGVNRVKTGKGNRSGIEEIKKKQEWIEQTRKGKGVDRAN